MNHSVSTLHLSEADKAQFLQLTRAPKEAEGDPEHGIAHGTPLEDLPEDWACADCGASKHDYDLVD